MVLLDWVNVFRGLLAGNYGFAICIAITGFIDWYGNTEGPEPIDSDFRMIE